MQLLMRLIDAQLSRARVQQWMELLQASSFSLSAQISSSWPSQLQQPHAQEPAASDCGYLYTFLDMLSVRCRKSQQPRMQQPQEPRETALWVPWRMPSCTMPTSSTNGTQSWRQPVLQRRRRSTSSMRSCCRDTWHHVTGCRTRYVACVFSSKRPCCQHGAWHVHT